MDRIDRKLLNLLQRNAARTNADLAAEVGLSPSSCQSPGSSACRSGFFSPLAKVASSAVPLEDSIQILQDLLKIL